MQEIYAELNDTEMLTNFCIDASVKSAFERGYRVIIPMGTNSTMDNDYMDGETTYKYYNEMMWLRDLLTVFHWMMKLK